MKTEKIIEGIKEDGEFTRILANRHFYGDMTECRKALHKLEQEGVLRKSMTAIGQYKWYNQNKPK